jgi:hypothetical protein
MKGKKNSSPFIQEIANPRRTLCFSWRTGQIVVSPVSKAERAVQAAGPRRHLSIRGISLKSGAGGSVEERIQSTEGRIQSTELCWFGCGPAGVVAGATRIRNRSIRKARVCSSSVRTVTKRLFRRPCLAFPHGSLYYSSTHALEKTCGRLQHLCQSTPQTLRQYPKTC